jgi:hypothetical protein
MGHLLIADERPKKFVATEDADIDYRTCQRTFSGRMTRARYKLIHRYCRRNSFSTHCGHEWDCCGCLCRQRLSFYGHLLYFIRLFLRCGRSAGDTARTQKEITRF